MSKAGLVVIAFKKIQSLPQRKVDPAKYTKLMKFERGIGEFYQNTLKRSYAALRNEFE